MEDVDVVAYDGVELEYHFNWETVVDCRLDHSVNKLGDLIVVFVIEGADKRYVRKRTGLVAGWKIVDLGTVGADVTDFVKAVVGVIYENVVVMYFVVGDFVEAGEHETTDGAAGRAREVPYSRDVNFVKSVALLHEEGRRSIAKML